MVEQIRVGMTNAYGNVVAMLAPDNELVKPQIVMNKG
jgi:hypothetical protein